MKEQYREKPRVIEARLFDGDQQALMDVVAWVQENGYVWFDMFTPAPSTGVSMDPNTGFLILVNNKAELATVQRGEWIVRQPTGVLEKMSAEEFQATYEKVIPTTTDVPTTQPSTPVTSTTAPTTPTDTPITPTGTTTAQRQSGAAR